MCLVATTSLDCEAVVAGFAFYDKLGLVRWSAFLAGIGFFWCTFFHCLPKSFRTSGLVSQVL